MWGVVFEIDKLDIEALDRSEGYRPDREANAYRRIDVEVVREGEPEERLLVRTYVVCAREKPNPVPHRDYVARIVAGARSWNLPSDYMQALERTKVST